MKTARLAVGLSFAVLVAGSAPAALMAQSPMSDMLRLANDPTRPEQGTLNLEMDGGA